MAQIYRQSKERMIICYSKRNLTKYRLANQIAIAIQRGNATMILEALKHSQRASARPHRA
jgi:hypothetical protein